MKRRFWSCFLLAPLCALGCSADSGPPDNGATSGASGAGGSSATGGGGSTGTGVGGATVDGGGKGDAVGGSAGAGLRDAADGGPNVEAGDGSTTGDPMLLSQTGLYANIATGDLAPGVIAYEPQFGLWSDGATKKRWIKLPPGSKI